MRSRPLLIGTLFVACAGLLPAQTNETNVTFRAVCFRHCGGLTSLHFRAQGSDGMKELALWTAEFTRPERMKIADGKAVFYVPDTTPNAKEPFKPLASVAVPDSPRLLFLFLPAAAPAADNPAPANPNANPYEIRVMAADDRSYPLGQTRVLNLAPTPMRIQLGEHEKIVAPTKGDILPKPTRLNRYDQFNVIIDFQRGEEWMRVSNTRWKSSDRKRDLVIAFFDPATKRPMANLFEDVPATVDPNAVPTNPAPTP